MSHVDSLKIKEIFYSLQGETNTSGWPTVFVRLTGCPLRCQYCDSEYAFSGGKRLSLNEIVQQVEHYLPRFVCVTGGEPLAQPACLQLLNSLCDKGYFVSLETSGALDISEVDKRVMVVLDIKTPDSKEAEKNRLTNLEHIKKTDTIKFVLCSQKDYQWAKQFIVEHQLVKKAEILFSPSWEQLPPKMLADWIVRDNLPVRFQIQLHKVLWGDLPGY